MKARIAAVLAALSLAAVAVTAASASPSDSKSELLRWYDLTAAAISTSGFPEQSTQEHVWAVAWLAAARAVAGNSDSRYDGAALASALHDTLSVLVPASAAQVDEAQAESLDTIPDGPQKERGAAAGRASAAAVLAERANDGYDTASVNAAWTPPAPAPGVYQLTGGPVVRAGLPFARPFVLESAHQLDPEPPPALVSARYRAALTEVEALGAATSTARTAEQTAVALFWAQSSLVTYTQIVREVIAADPRSLANQARTVAVFHLVELDQQIAIHAAKYRYVFWRPVTAIRATRDPSWTPLISTPRHPEYPSGHAGYGGTADVVLAALAPSQAHDAFSASSSTAGGATRSWVGWRAITDETVDARVWEGVHFRFSDEEGAALGRAVARYDLAHLSRIGL